MFTSAVLLLAASMAADQVGASPREKVQAAMEYLVGDWEVEGTDADKPLKAKGSVRWASAKNCLIGTFKGDTENATGISGRDPSTNDFVETLYLADGTRIENRYSHFSEKVWEGTSIAQLPSGEVDKAPIRLEKNTEGFTFIKKGVKRTLILKNRRVNKQVP